MSEKAEGGLSDTSNPMWEKSERAARKYCGSYGYEQEPMKLARIIYDAICEPAPALQSLSPEREADIHALFKKATGYTVEEYKTMVEGVKNGN